jgi:beta-mannosidase
LYWQLNDCWPVSSWSGIDYYGDWKALHYAVKKAFKNLKISFKTNNDNLEVFIISDSLQNTKASLELTIIDFYGNILNKLEKDIVVESNCSQVYLCKDIPDLVLGNDLNNVLISAVLSDSKRNVIDESLYYFVPPKDLKLPDPKVTIEVENRENNMVAFKLATEVLAKNVYLQCNVEGHFSENYFDLLPNSEMKLFFISEEEVDINDLRKGLTVYTLVDSFE